MLALLSGSVDIQSQMQTLLPIAEQLLQPEVVPQALEGLMSTRAKQAAQYNKQAKDLPQRKVGDTDNQFKGNLNGRKES